MNLYDITPSKTETILNFTESFWKERIGRRAGLEQQWFLQIAWFAGQQNTYWSGEHRALMEANVPLHKPRVFVNRLNPIGRKIISKIYNGEPTWDVIPVTAESDDLVISDMSKQLLEYRWHQLNVEEEWLEALYWTICTGQGFVKSCWDPDAGDKLSISPEDLVEQASEPNVYELELRKASKYFKENFGDSKSKQDLPIGDTKVECVSPFEMDFDTEAKSFYLSPWCMQTTFHSVEFLRDKYGNRKIEANANGASGVGNYLPNKLSQLSGNPIQPFGSSPSKNSDKAVHHEFYIRPHGKGKFAKGRFIIVAGGQVVKNVEFPYNHGQHPYVHIKELHVPGVAWGTCSIAQLMPLQAQVNKRKNQQIEIRELLANPRILRPRGATNKDAFTDRPGEIVDYTYPMKPEIMQPPQLPAYFSAMFGEDMTDIEEVSGQHEVSKAQAPGDVRGTGGILALVEQDESQQRPIITHMTKQLQKLGRLVLSTDAQYVKEDRLARIVGQDNSLISFTFKGTELVGQNAGRPGVDYFDVRIQTTSGLPQNRAAQNEILSGLITMGVLDPREDKKVILSLLGIGQTISQLDQSRPHRSKAINENNVFMQGQITVPQPYEDHDVHLEVHQQFQNTSRYEVLPDEVKQAVQLHIENHKMLKAREMVEPEILIQMAAMTIMAEKGLQQPTEGNENEKGKREGAGVRQGQAG